AEFMRRIYLDLAGRIPSVAEAREFLADRSPEKRRQLIERLLNGPDYVTHWTRYWRTLFLPEFNDAGSAVGFGAGLENWLRPRVTDNLPYDRLVREVLTHPVTSGRILRPLDREAPESGPSPEGFYLSREIRAENLAAGTSRLFLGVRLECAQCHNHPFAKWKREQFWEYAAFFSGIQTPPGQGGFMATNDLAEKREIKISGTDKVVQARFLDRAEPKWQEKVSTR